MIDLPIQPPQGMLTRITDPVRVYRRDPSARAPTSALYVFAACYCGRVVRIAYNVWRDGWKRPGSCTYCAKAKQRFRTKLAINRAHVVPHWVR